MDSLSNLYNILFGEITHPPFFKLAPKTETPLKMKFPTETISFMSLTNSDSFDLNFVASCSFEFSTYGAVLSPSTVTTLLLCQPLHLAVIIILKHCQHNR